MKTSKHQPDSFSSFAAAFPVLDNEFDFDADGDDLLFDAIAANDNTFEYMD
jgi:hypothetical protein